MLRKAICAILFCNSFFYANCQEFKQGIILPEKENKICCVYMPPSGLKIYDMPNGKIVGEILPDSSNNWNLKEFYSADIIINGVRKDFTSPNLELIGADFFAIPFKNIQSGFAQLINNYWIDIEILKEHQFKLVSWMEFIVYKGDGWTANSPGLNLRSEPTPSSDLIATMKGDNWVIHPSAETNGNWCKVKVIHYNTSNIYSDDRIIIEEFVGWAKLISDNGTPNIWFNPKGC